MKVRWYQRNYVIDPSMQLKIVGFLATIAIVMASIIIYISYNKITQLGVLFNQSIIVPVAKEAAFNQIATSLMFSLLIVVIFMIILFAGAGIILTHRVAGPIFRLQSEVKKLLRGEDIHPVKFRKNDEFHELAELINELIARIPK